MKTRILGLVAVASVVLAITAALALAHEATVFHGSDYAQVLNGHADIVACDNENDGHFVRAHWRNGAGNITAGGRTAGPGWCVQDFLGSGAVEFRVCEEVVGCSAWIAK